MNTPSLTNTRNLYYVKAYCWSSNEWCRFAVTAQSYEDAMTEVQKNEPRMSQISARYVCTTTDDTYIEL